MRSLIIVTILLCGFFILNCKKHNDEVAIHCNNLVNDILPEDDKALIEVASAFTPNRDGLNDSFRPYVFNIKSASIKVYDVKSNLLFQTDQLNREWYPDKGIDKYEKFYYRIEGITLKNNKIGKCGEVYALLCYPPGMEKNFSFEDMLQSTGFTGTTRENLTTCY
ncbi:hypothetical protein DC498_25035 [Terrimonas sp.]|uniref:gliding motility-associated C-terminal domain-containing protein n=1 Tax=Terrimonas sp. TaxID=1914338 RepID=UPI000D512C23|nr:gliding motility-associated C-terminal domain-containing protein [Terrimonas sp.]PVD49432.1 hypothetical protein DC498_25035 [Terrimonas sp.]